MIDIVQSESNTVEYVVVKSFVGKEVIVKAKIFVLCAGAIENPRLLLNSSIKPDIKNNKLSLMSNNTENLNKKDPYNERQTVDVDLDIEYKAKNKKFKKNKKSRYGSWS